MSTFTPSSLPDIDLESKFCEALPECKKRQNTTNPQIRTKKERRRSSSPDIPFWSLGMSVETLLATNKDGSESRVIAGKTGLRRQLCKRYRRITSDSCRRTVRHHHEAPRSQKIIDERSAVTAAIVWASARRCRQRVKLVSCRMRVSSLFDTLSRRSFGLGSPTA